MAGNPVTNRSTLFQFLNDEMESLTGILRVYALRAGLAGDDDAVSELLNGVVVEALAHAARFDPSRPPRAWLLGIAANLVHRRQVEAARLNRREPLANDLFDARQELLDEDELFERLARGAPTLAGLGDLQSNLEDRDGLAVALALLPAPDREVVRLFAGGSADGSALNGDALAAALGVSPGAARVRLHRALTRLRRVWHLTQEEKTHD